jgi:antitoxin MazE
MYLLCRYIREKTMKTNVQKWGNSLAVRIPRSFAEEMGIGNNAPVEMSLEEGALVIKADRDRQWDLDTLLAQVTDENIHSEWETEGAGEGSNAGEPERELR